RGECRSCILKAQCCPKLPLRRVQRSIYEEARDVARALAKTEAFERSRHDRKRVEMLFAHLKRILRLGRLRLRGPRGAQFEFTLPAIAQNLRSLAKLVARARRRGAGGGAGALGHAKVALAIVRVVPSRHSQGERQAKLLARRQTAVSSSATSATKSAKSGLMHCSKGCVGVSLFDHPV